MARQDGLIVVIRIADGNDDRVSDVAIGLLKNPPRRRTLLRGWGGLIRRKLKSYSPGGKKHLCRQFSAIAQDDKNVRSIDDRMRVRYNDAGGVNDDPGRRAVEGGQLGRGGMHEPGKFGPYTHDRFFSLLDTVDQPAMPGPMSFLPKKDMSFP